MQVTPQACFAGKYRVIDGGAAEVLDLGRCAECPKVC